MTSVRPRYLPLPSATRPTFPATIIPAIENLLLRVARLVEEVPEISELDLNPVLAQPPGQGCAIVDARIRVGAGW